jgi:hypothetical protein
MVPDTSRKELKPAVGFNFYSQFHLSSASAISGGGFLRTSSVEIILKKTVTRNL